MASSTDNVWRRRLFIAIAAIVLIVVGAVVYRVIWGQPATTSDAVVRPGVNSPASVAPNNLDRTRNLFGPWQLAAPGSTGAPALVLLGHNGGMEVSSWSVPADNTWLEIEPMLISAVTAGGKAVDLTTSDHHTFTVSYDQAFVIEAQPDRVYAVRHGDNGGYIIVGISTDQASRLGNPPH